MRSQMPSQYLSGMDVCGLVLSTKDLRFFALRCSRCKEKDFGQWSSFLAHLQDCHGEELLNPFYQSQDDGVPAPKVEKDDAEELTVDQIKEESPDQSAAMPEPIFEVAQVDQEEKEDSKSLVFESAERMVGQVRLSPTPDLTARPKFKFDLCDAQRKDDSLEFLEILQNRPFLWDTTHSDFRFVEKRREALRDIVAHLRQRGLDVSVDDIRETFVEILKNHRALIQSPAAVVDEEQGLFLKHCHFLDVSKHKAKTDVVPKKEVKDEETDEDSEEEHSSGSANEEDPTDEALMDIKSYTDDESVHSSDVETAPKDRLVVSTTRFKRIRFNLPSNPISFDFVRMLRDSPIIWDRTLPYFNNKMDRLRILEKWATTLTSKYDTYFTYDDMTANVRELRIYICSLLKKQKLGETAKRMLKECEFLQLKKSTSRLKCEHCVRFFLTEHKYRTHLYNVHNIGDSPFHCGDCALKFETERELETHERLAHNKLKKFACTECNKDFKRCSELKAHMQMHTGQMQFVCETCGKSFRRRMNLKNHETRVHLRQRNYMCEHCPKAFYTKALLKDHINAHFDIRNHKCPLCSKGFHSAHTLMRHKQTHSKERAYVCNFCNASFNQYVGLNVHKKNVHQFEEPKKQRKAQREAEKKDGHSRKAPIPVEKPRDDAIELEGS